TLAEKYKTGLILVNCTCPKDIVKKRLEERLKHKSISDGRWEIYISQRRNLEPFREDIEHIDFDTSNNSYTYRQEFYNKLLTLLEKSSGAT
ncbi:MAG: AAA family ATPase, partial [Candidatus Thermoplasmatota archaeon]